MTDMNTTGDDGYFVEERSAETVIARMRDCDDPRLKEIMAVVTRKLHEAVKEIEPTEEEWMKAIHFLTEVGQICNEWRRRRLGFKQHFLHRLFRLTQMPYCRSQRVA